MLVTPQRRRQLCGVEIGLPYRTFGLLVASRTSSTDVIVHELLNLSLFVFVGFVF